MRIRKIFSPLGRLVFLIFLLLSVAQAGFGQSFSYTLGNLSVAIDVFNPCSLTAPSQGAIRFRIISTEGGANAQIAVVGPVNLFPAQIVPEGGTFTFNPSTTLPVGSYTWIIGDNTNTIGSIVDPVLYPPLVLTQITSPGLTKDIETNNSSCITPNGQIQASISGGSKILPGGGSFTYSWSSSNGVVMPPAATTDGNTPLNLATLLGVPGLRGGTYTLTVNDNYSFCLSTVVFTITDPSPTAFNITTPSPLNICSGDNITITLDNSESGVTYEILRGVSPLPTPITFLGTGVGPFVMTFPSTQFVNGNAIQVQASNGFCTTVLMTGSVSLVINPLPTITGVAITPVCEGGTTTNLTYTSTTGSPNQYSIDFDATAQGQGFVDVVNAALTASPVSITVPPAALPNTYNATLSIRNSITGCVMSSPIPLTIVINPLPVLVAPQAKTICTGDNVAYEILLTPANLPAGTVFNWPDPDGVGPATAGVNVPMGVAGTIHINDVLLNPGTAPLVVTYVVTPTSGALCLGAPQNINITVSPRPVLVVGQSKAICSGNNVAHEILLNPANLPSSTVFNWPDPDGAGPATAGVNVPMGIAGTTHINDVLTNATGSPITVTYVVTPSVGSCAGTPQNVAVTVNPAPALVVGQSKIICNGDNVAYEILLTPANLPLGTVFNWPDPDGAGPATAGVNVPMGAAGTIHINDVLVNAGTTPVVVTYVVTPTSGTGCPGAPQNINITVSATPVLVAGQSKAICSGDNTAHEILLNPANLPLGTVFNWPDPDGAGPATAGVNVPMGTAGTTHINNILTNATTSPITVTYVVTPSVGGFCPGTPQNVAITVNPVPVLVAGQAKTICTGDNVAYEILLTPANLPLGTVFNWPDPDGAGPGTAGVNVPMGVAGTIHINDVLVNAGTAPLTVTYTVTPTSGSCPGIPRIINITVSPRPVLAVGQSKTICAGENTALEILLNPANLPLGTVFNWPDPDGAGPATAGVDVPMGIAGTTHINNVLTNATTSPITVTYVVTPSIGGLCPGNPQNVDITVNPAPVLAAGQAKTICTGDNVAYEILLTPANLPLGTVFNWPDPDGAGPATAGTNVPMGVAGTIHINDALVNAGTSSLVVTYVVTPTGGSCPGIPQNIDITVNPRPVLVAGQTKTICSGDNVAHEILLTPANLPLGTVFNWPDPDGAGPATAGTNVPVGSAGTIHINDVLVNAGTASMVVTYVVTPSISGLCAGVPQNINITVNPRPVLVAAQTKTICSGDNAAYEILLTPTNLPLGTVFNWPDPDGAGPATAGVNVPMGTAGTTHINDVLTNATSSAITVTYVITPSIGGLCPGIPQNVAITVNPTPVLVAAQAKTICSGDNAAYEILLNPANLPLGTVFNWPDPDGAGPATAGVNVPMGTAGTTHINDVFTNATSSAATVTYVITPSIGGLCPGTPQNVIITVNPTPVLVAAQSKTICGGDNVAYEILLNPANLPLGTVFNWPDPDGAGPATAGVSVPMGAAGTTHINDVLTNATANAITVTYVITPSIGGLCPGTPQNVAITVNPAPVLVTGQAKTICSGDNVAYEILLNPANLPLGTVFNWPDPDGAGPATAGVNVPMGTAGTTHINDVFTNATSSAITVTYVVTPSAGGLCPGTPQNVIVTVNPTPVLVAAQSKTICSGDNVAYEILLNPANLPLGTVFNWTDPDGAGPATAGVNVAMGAAGTIHINDVLVNTGSASLTVTYAVTASIGGLCAGVPQNIDITVSPRPVLVAGQAKTICGGENVAYEILLTPTNLPLGTVFNWPDPDGAGPAIAGVNVPMGVAGTTHINDVLLNTGTTPLVVTYAVTPSAGSCAGTPQNVAITVNPAPTASITGTTSICSGSSTSLTVNFTGTGPWSFTFSDGVTTSAAIPSFFNTITFPVGPLTASTTYTIISVSDATPCPGIVTGTPAVVTVNQNPTVNLPLGVTIDPVCFGGTSGVTVTTSQTGVSYQLRNNVGNVVIGTPVIGTGGTITLPTGSLNTTTTFNVLATATGCASAQLTGTATVNVNGNINAGLGVAALVNPICDGGSTSIRITASENGVLYQLRNDTGDVNIGAAVPGTGGNIDIPTGNLTTTTTFNILASNGTCSIELTDLETVNIDVAPDPALAVGVTTDPLCVGGISAVTISLSEVGVNYQLRNEAGDVNIGTPVAGTGGTINISTGVLNATTTFNILATGLGACPSVELTNQATVNVAGSIDANLVVTSAASPICEGSSTDIQIELSESGVDYQLRNDLDDSVIGAVVAGTGGTILLPTGNLSLTTSFNVLASNATCSIELTDIETVDVDVAPDPSLIVSVTIDPLCVGGTSAVNIDLSEVGVSYQLRNDVGDVNVGTAVMGTGGTISLPTGPLATTTTFNILASSGGVCPDAELTSLATVNVAGSIDNSLAVTSSAGPVCAGTSTLIQVENSEVGVNYQLRNDAGDVNVGAVVAGTGATINLPTGNLASTTTFNVLASNVTCSIELTDTETVTVNPAPDISLAVSAASGLICSGTSTNIIVSFSEAGVSYQLRNSTGNVLVGSAVVGTGGNINLPTGSLVANTTFNIFATIGTCSAQLTAIASVTIRPVGDLACGGGGSNCFAFATSDPVIETRPSCANQNDGELIFGVKGGTGTYVITLYDSSSVPIFTQAKIGSSATPIVFSSLSPSLTYFYKIDDGTNTCTLPYSLPVQTTVTASATSFTDAQCFGEPTGSAIINASGSQTGQYFYSTDNGVNWTLFTPGNVISGLPPNGTYNVLVGESTNDACVAAVSVTINNANPDLQIATTITGATCNNDDGMIVITPPTAPNVGGGGPYQYALSIGTTTTPFQSGTTFDELPGGIYSILVQDGLGCVKTITPVNVTFPGFVNFTISASPADCTNNGISGSITVDITDIGGVYKVALSTDQFNEPEPGDYIDYSEPSITFPPVVRGTYFVYVQSQTASCPTRSAAINIDGSYAVDFDIEPVCADNKVSIILSNITGEPNTPFSIQIFDKFDPLTPIEDIPVAAIPVTGAIRLDYDDYAFLQTPNKEYLIQINQVQSTFCAFLSPLENYITTRSLFASVKPRASADDGESYPDEFTGKLGVIDFDGGVVPYEIKIELTAPAVPGQSFETDFEEVQENSNLQFEKLYENIPAGQYDITVQDSLGCTLTLIDTVPLDIDLFIPNIFTPNNDALNDVFFVRNLPVNEGKLTITDRWGVQVFSTSSYQNDWAGDGLADGVYYYTLQTLTETKKGWVEILRGVKP